MIKIPILNWIDDIIEDAFKSVYSTMKNGMDNYSKSIDIFKIGRKRYFSYIKERYGQIQILGMSVPILLEDLYIRIKINQQISTKRYLDLIALKENEHHYKKWLSKERSRESENPMNILSDFNRVIILGKPGCGKTTLFKFLSLLYTGSIHNISITKQGSCIPFIMVLREFHDKDIDLMGYIVETFRNCGFPYPSEFINRVLKQGKFLLMLDGLDEISYIKQNDVKKQVETLIAEYNEIKIVISCRIAAFKQTYEGFYEFEIDDFDQIQKYRFVRKWFKTNVKLSNGLIKAIKSQPRLSELAENPLLLSLICILYQRNLDIPKNQVELYEKCINTMLNEWDISRGFRRCTDYEKLSDLKKIRLFNYLAYYFFIKNEKIFHAKELIKEIGYYIKRYGIGFDESSQILKEIESHHGILIPISVRAYCFSHLTFQEYFTACYLVDTRSELIILDFIEDPRWIEVFRIVTSLLEDSTFFLNKLFDQKVKNNFYKTCLAAYCMSGDITVSGVIKKKIVSELLNDLHVSSKQFKRLYITRNTLDSPSQGIFFELYNVDSKEAILEREVRYHNFVKIISIINCMVSIFSSSFLKELKLICKSQSNHKYFKLLNYLFKCKTDGSKVIVYSDALRQGGIELPIDISSFENLVHAYFNKEYFIK